MTAVAGTMHDHSASKTFARFAGWFALLVVAAVLLVAGRDLLFSTFMVYDDEGYVLISLRNFVTQGPLYDEVYSQYGPFFYLWHKALGALGGWQWTNTTGRWLTLAYWFGTAALSADLVRRLCGSLSAAVVTLSATFCYLWVMIHEPSHPGGMIGFLLALVAWIGVRRDPAYHPGAAVAIAAIGAAVALSKINTGVFLLMALWGWLVAHSRGTRPGRVLTIFTGMIFIAAPAGVMQGLSEAPWVQTYIAVATLALAGVGAVCLRQSPAVARIGHRWLGAILGGLATIVLVVGITRATGTSWSGLLHGVLLDPLRHPGVYSFAFVWRPGSLALAALAVIIVSWWWIRPGDRLLRHVIAGLRIVAALGMAASILRVLPLSMPAFGLTYGISLAALCAVPLIDDALGRARRWIALLCVWQSLQAYPVAGSQLNWGTFLWVPLLVLAVEETVRWTAPARRRVAGRCGFAGAWLLAGFAALALADTARLNRSQGDPLSLPGAENIVLPSHTAFPIRILAENAARSCDPLFTFTGAYSFNLWTGVRPPTLANATHWFSLLSDAQQDAIIAELEASPRAGIVVQLDTVRFLLNSNIPINGRLADYIANQFQPVLEVDTYALWLKRGRAFAPFQVAEWDDDARRLRVRLPEQIGPVTAVEFWRYDNDLRKREHRWEANAFTWRAEPSPADGGGIVGSLILAEPAPESSRDGLLFLLDESGTRQAFVRVLPNGPQ